MSQDVVLWTFFSAFVLLIVSSFLVIRYKIRHRGAAGKQLLDEYCTAFMFSGVTEVNAASLAKLQLYIKDEGLKTALPDFLEMAHLIKQINYVCERIRLHPDKSAINNLESIALPLMAQKNLESFREFSDTRKHFNFWYYVVRELHYLSASSKILIERLTERLIFQALMADLHKCTLTVSDYEYYVSQVAKRCETDNCVDRWSKWLMEDEIFRDMLEKDLQGFRKAGEITDAFREYFRQYHIKAVSIRLKNIADELALIQMKKRFFADGGVQVPNDTYLKVADAYKSFYELLI